MGGSEIMGHAPLPGVVPPARAGQWSCTDCSPPARPNRRMTANVLLLTGPIQVEEIEFTSYAPAARRGSASGPG